jgi:RNA polymerase sigma-70 factor (ECF subfamily)
MAERDEVALSEFYDRYHRPVYSLVLRVLGSSSDAEDVVVDVFWQVWQQAGQYAAERGKVFTWLMTIARSRAIDRRRGLQRQDIIAQALEFQQRDAVEPVADPDETLFVAERRRRVRAALDVLPETQRRAIELAYYGGLSQSEIATVLNEPLGTVKTRIRAGLAQLREGLRPYVS